MADFTLPVVMATTPSLAPQRSDDGQMEDGPTLLPSSHTSLIDAEEDMTALLANVMRRQTSRRMDKSTRKETAQRQTTMDRKHGAELSRILGLLKAGNLTFGGAYEQARALFPDMEELALVLAGLRDDHELDAEVQAEVDQALATLMREHGHAKLSLGLNTRQVVNEFASRMNVSGDELRRAYRALAGASTGESVTYRYLINTFGFSRRGLVLDFLEQALAADIAADTPSHPPEEFQPLLALLFQLRLLRSADALLLSSAGHHRRRRQKKGSQDEPELFDQAVVDLLLAALSDIQEACRHFMHCLKRWLSFAGADGVSEWAGRVLRAIAEVPIELFPDLTYRQALLTSLSEVADNLFRSRRGSGARLRSLRV